MTDQRFPRAHRVRRDADFRRAFARRCAVSDGRLVVFGHPNGLGHARLGVSVPRRIGKAVVRNRWKRLLREAFRLTRFRLPVGVDLIVVPRAGPEPELAELVRSLPRLARRVAGKLDRENSSPSSQ